MSRRGAGVDIQAVVVGEGDGDGGQDGDVGGVGDVAEFGARIREDGVAGGGWCVNCRCHRDVGSRGLGNGAAGAAGALIRASLVDV